MENEELGRPRFTEDDILQITPPGSAPASGAPGSQPRDFFGPEGALEQNAEETRRPVDYEDISRENARSVFLGLGDIVGSPGSLGQLYDVTLGKPMSAIGQAYDTAKEKLIRHGVLGPAEYFNLIPKGGADRMVEEAKKIGGPQFPSAERGETNVMFGLPVPTSTGVEKFLKEKYPQLAVEPQTPEAESIGKSVRLGTSMIAPGGGGAAGAIGRFGAGAIGSQIGQGAENLQREMGFIQPGSGYEEYVEPAGTLAGTIGALMLGKGVRNVVVPGAKSAEDLASAMAKDFGGENPRVNREFVEQALREGNMSMADIFGPGTATRAYIEAQAARSGSAGKALLDDFNSTTAPIEGTGVSRRIPEAQANVSRTLTSVSPVGSLDAPAIQQATQDANLLARRNIYNVTRAEPAAQAITIDQLGPAVKSNQYIQEAVDKITRMAPDLPREWGVVAPRQIPQQSTGVLGPNGQPIVRPATQTPGNLAFWDSVKRSIDEEIENLSSARQRLDATDQMRLNSLMQAKKDLLRQVDQQGNLVGGLDYIVPSYPNARAAAGELIGQDNAVKTGSQFFKRMEQFGRDEARTFIQTMSPEARNLAKTGWLSELNEQIATRGGLNAAASRLAAEPAFAENMRLILGRDYERVAGSLLSQNMRAQTKAIPLTEEGLLKAAARNKGALASAGAAGAYQAENIVNMMTMGFTPTQVATLLTTGAAAAATTGAARLQTSRVANEAVRLALSERPADHIRLLRLVEDDPKLRSQIAKLNAGFQIYNQQQRESAETTAEAPRALGGRVGRATGGRVGVDVEADALVRAAERAKKSFNKTTEPLLNAPDNHIAKALEVANKAI